MVKFEPEVAYRILSRRQSNYYDRMWSLIFEKSELWVMGRLPPWGEKWYEDEISWYQSEGDKMYDVLEYLRDRIEEERNDAV